MHAVVKSLSVDDLDLRVFQPEDPGCFALNIHLRIGPQDSASADDFELCVCTPRWLEKVVSEPRWGRHLLIVSKYDIGVIEGFINFHVTNCHGDKWSCISERLARVLHWEFEDYQA